MAYKLKSGVVDWHLVVLSLAMVLGANQILAQENVPFDKQFEKCPDTDISPCVCRSISFDITCGSGINDPNTLRYIFQGIKLRDNTSVSTLPRYTQLIVEKSPLEKILSRSFESALFLSVTIKDNYYLTIFEEDTFVPTNQNLTIALNFRNNPNLGSTKESMDSLFATVQSFIMVEVLIINECGLQYIPTYAFGAPGLNRLTRLKRVTLSGNKLKTVQIHAFTNMASLRSIIMHFNPLERIEPYAIDLAVGKCDPDSSYSKQFYLIDLSNNGIDSTTLAPHSIRTDCSLKLKLSNNSIHYLPESTFRPLFTQHTTIDLFGNNLDCNNCDMAWLLKGRVCASFNDTLRYRSLIESSDCKEWTWKSNCAQTTNGNEMLETDGQYLPCPGGWSTPLLPTVEIVIAEMIGVIILGTI